MQSSIHTYFQLQCRRLYRGVAESGIPLALAIIGILAIYFGGSAYLYFKTTYAPYVILIFAISLLSRLSAIERNDFLVNTFSKKDYQTIRLLENGAVIVPFLGLLVFHQNYMETCVLIGVAFIMSFLKTKSSWNKSIPTPFSKNPFEFTIGFRSSILVILLAYAIVVGSIALNNFNFGIAGLVLLYITALTFYLQPEPAYYVWIYACTPKQFLKLKLTTALRQSSLLALPLIITLLIAFPASWIYVLLFTLVGQLFLLTIILAKYSAFPNEINLPEGIMIALCISFPPFLFVLIPYFYSKAIKKLYPLLS